MKKHGLIILLIVSFVCFFASLFYNFNYSKKSINISDSNYFPSLCPEFNMTILKIKKDEKVVIKVTNGEKEKVKYKVDDPNKIRIVSSSYQGCIIECISSFKGEIVLTCYNEDYQELRDYCYITCYNEIISCEHIFIYKKNLNETNENSEIALSDGEYFLEFDVTMLDEESSFEDESIYEIGQNVSNFFSCEAEETEALHYDFAFRIYVVTKMVFTSGRRKTMSFKVDQAYFIASFILGD